MPERLPASGGAEASQRLTMLPLFAGLRPEDAEALVRSCEARLLQPGERLFAQGDAAVDLYIVLDGVLDIAVAASEGEAVLVGQVGPGDLVGEMGVVEAVPRSASAAARTSAHVLCLDGGSFRTLIDAAHPAAWTLLRAIRRTLARRVVALRAAEAGSPLELGLGDEGARPTDESDAGFGLVTRLRGLLDSLVGTSP